MHKSDVAFGSVLALLAGVAIAGLGWSAFWALFLTAVFVAALFFAGGRAAGLRKPAALFWLLFCAGIFYYHFFLNIKAAGQNIVFGERTTFYGIISGEPKGFDTYQILDVRLRLPLRGEISVLASPLADFRYGDLLKINGAIEPSDSPARAAVAAFPKTIEVVSRDNGFWLKETLLNFKSGLLGVFAKNLSKDEAALLSGIVFGYRSGFGNDFRKQMSLSGTTHLVALSGYNITIIVLALAYVLGCFLSGRKTFYATAAAIFLFVLMVGAEASVVRAAIMGFLALLARETGRIYSMRNAIVFTAAAMTLADPAVLVYDAGFQLSFASLLGIVYLGPALKNFLHLGRDGGFADWREIAATTASAQLAVLPLIIGYFGQFSLTAILANILILGFMPLTMFFGFLLAALGSLYFYLGFFAAKLVGLLLAYEIFVIKFFASLRLPLPGFAGGNWFLILLYYGALVSFVVASARKNKLPA